VVSARARWSSFAGSIQGQPKGSLRRKIIIWSFVPAAIILAAVAFINFQAYRLVTEDLVIERDRELTRLRANQLGTRLHKYTDPLNAWARTAFVYEGDSTALSDALRRARNRFEVFDGGVTVFDAYGAIVTTEPELPESWTPGWQGQTSVHRTVGVSGPIFSGVVSDQSLDDDIIVIATPITGRQDEYLGAIAGAVRLGPGTGSTFYDRIEKLHGEEYGSVYLVDGSGRVIYHSDAGRAGEDLSQRPVVQQALAGDVNAYRTQDHEDRDIVASFAPVPGTSWSLIVEESWEALTSSSRGYRQFLLLLLAMGVLVPTLIVTIGVRHITQPISDLIGAAQNVAKGNFDQQISASTGDELEELARQFNLMALQLQESYANLEQKVAARTKELQTLNAIAAEVSHSLDLKEILNNALDQVLEVMGLDAGQAFRLDEETQTLLSIVHHGLSDEFAHFSHGIPLDLGLAGQAAEKDQPVVRAVADYPEGELRDRVGREGLLWVISIPLIAQGRAVGAINLGSRSPGTVTPEELSLLAAIGHQIGVAVENARLYEQAQQLAVIKERNRLARDLHDSVTQALYGVTLYSEAAARQLRSGQIEMAVDHLSEIRITAQESLGEMRLLIFELRLPMLKNEGMAAAIQARLEAVESRVGLETRFDTVGDVQLSPAVEDGLFRIAQEALNNTLRHACASSVSVCLRQDDRVVTLEIADDGIGFDPEAIQEQGGFGLRGMMERTARLGGKLRLQTSPGGGTSIRVEVCQ
jgi:nitrate/nitrite-specific signal transduction histidine kinase